jgi:hypothetical protein
MFVSIQHGHSSVGMVELGQFQQYGVSPATVLHLNHEEPWETDSDSFNYVFGDGGGKRLGELYRGFPLVLRNYYYAPLHTEAEGDAVVEGEGEGDIDTSSGSASTPASTSASTSTPASTSASTPTSGTHTRTRTSTRGGSHYLSVGAPHYQFVIGNLSSPIFLAATTPASQRYVYVCICMSVYVYVTIYMSTTVYYISSPIFLSATTPASQRY